MGVVLGAIAVVLALAALVGPWWTLDKQNSLESNPRTVHSDYDLFGITWSGQSNSSGSLTATDSSGYAYMAALGSVFADAAGLTTLGMFFGVGMIISAARSRRRPSFRGQGAVLGILAFLCILLAALYVLSALPGAANRSLLNPAYPTTVSGFWGSWAGTTTYGVTFTLHWGAGWAWYLALVAAILFLIGGVTMLFARKPDSADFQVLEETGEDTS